MARFAGNRTILRKGIRGIGFFCGDEIFLRKEMSCGACTALSREILAANADGPRPGARSFLMRVSTSGDRGTYAPIFLTFYFHNSLLTLYFSIKLYFYMLDDAFRP
jgi:hypothetical protein